MKKGEKSSEYRAGRECVGRPCTLNGERAQIVGRLMPFALVRQLEGIGQAEYAWPTVARIMADGGRFQA